MHRQYPAPRELTQIRALGETSTGPGATWTTFEWRDSHQTRVSPKQTASLSFCLCQGVWVAADSVRWASLFQRTAGPGHRRGRGNRPYYTARRATEIFLARHINQGDVANHKVQSEYFDFGEKAAAQINQARAEGRLVIAIGTTVIRILEPVGRNDNPGGAVTPQEGWTGLYIYPGFEFKVADMLLTNLHAPRSTHLVLAAAFASKDLLKRSYDEIVENGGYEFNMFGDKMLIF
ncbi:hypothetical protein ASPWEDRAFT_183428 [Aspergillus wentii DTO 134E9]|uniref:S-adenosylmethionine:tRNA ribosyltransferase-isomerase n=1 Tax=Aspergillus wentii DTO 134E9 TaxID=1073089 RepID=A0A1L9RKB9_ASPWE|nr:uncharacterized protein ASPWEDRAFT_183428 [Aspergillus wentii DTO 134E9]KAI9924873.1 hypothetical protein MW887_006730 [Aspergillus wentii]OJJ35353.1 hypothetical protein ASPWEDRAFT_183428 [Aspergillus wentii DTO 134E9]